MSSLKTGSQYFDDVGFVDVTDALAIEANASATNALTSRVSSVEGTITSQGQQITSMQNSIKNKADASAVTNLTNRVTAAENQISSQSQSITSLSNSLDNANADADASKAIIGNMLKTTLLNVVSKVGSMSAGLCWRPRTPNRGNISSGGQTGLWR
ncbi:hypothetical protein IUJ34_26970 (plasmid) [Klebsiella pneumoniae subsp. pneumoniae]|uniref:Gp24 n=1 Tax=Klebsiella pneumoniae subsp. pneumoniae TaxID=72407 RepID=A0A7S9E1U4_KLEPN|nr:hypothetical protein IUJ34_26970 [Klebsiella pneumoniae subsp. pneumoniae]